MPTHFRFFARLLRYAVPYWPAFAAAAAALLIVAATETAFPALMKPLLDKGFTGGFNFPIWWVPVGVVFIFAIRGIFGFLGTYAMSWVGHNLIRDLRAAMFNKLLVMSAEAYDKYSSGGLISKIIAEVNNVTLAITNVLNTLVRDSFILIGLVLWLFWLNWVLTLVVLAVTPFLIWMSILLSRRMRRVSQATVDATINMTRSVEETIAGHRSIKLFQAEQSERDRFGRINRQFRAQIMRIVVTQAIQSPLSQLLIAIAVAVVLTIALIQSQQSAFSPGDFASFITAMLMLMSPVKHLADINGQLQRGLVAAEVVFGLIDEKSEADQGSLQLERCEGEICFCNVGFRYTSKDQGALENIDFRINPGETVAIIGRSGAGKSTLVNLLARLYDPSSGMILLDGEDIRNYTLKSLRSQIAYVSQDVFLFNESLRKNITFGLSEPSEQRMQEIIDAAYLTDFVAGLSDGLDTNVGDRGIRLSGGQRQRIAIARALLRDAPILVLDEATSALDVDSEARVRQALDYLRRARTTIVVAHRLSTIQSANKVILIDQGRVAGIGTHSELMHSVDLYRYLVEKSTQGLLIES